MGRAFFRGIWRTIGLLPTILVLLAALPLLLILMVFATISKLGGDE